MSSISSSDGRRTSGGLDVFYSAPPTVTGFYLIRCADRARFRDVRSALSQLILPRYLAIFSLAPMRA